MRLPPSCPSDAADTAERLPAAGARRHGGDAFVLYELPGFLTEAECNWLIAAIDRSRAPSPIFANRPDPDPDFRTSETCWMDHGQPRVARLYQALCDLLGIDPAHGERMQGQRYAPGQHFRPHRDAFDPAQPYWPMEQERGGQRTWTAMIFLDSPDGGETHFPMTGLRLPPTAGTLLAWNNLQPDGAPNPLALHEGCPVQAGTKHVVTQWFRERPCRKPGLVAALKRGAFRLLGRLR